MKCSGLGFNWYGFVKTRYLIEIFALNRLNIFAEIVDAAFLFLHGNFVNNEGL